MSQAGFLETTKPQFGIATSLVEGTVYPIELRNNHAAELIPFNDGWTKALQTLSLSEEMSVSHAYGDTRDIASSQVAGRNTFKVPITSARMSIREIVSEPWMRGLENNGDEPTPGHRLMCCDGMLVTGLRVQVSVIGKYNKDFYPFGHDPAATPAFGVGTVLSDTITIKPAVESTEEEGNLVTITTPFTSDAGNVTVLNPVVTEFNVIRTQDDWTEFSLTFEGQVGRTETFAAGSTHLLVPKLLLLATITAVSDYYALERIIELAEGRPAKMTETATMFPDADYPDGFPA